MTGVSGQEAESQMHGWHRCSSITVKNIFWLTMHGELQIIYNICCVSCDKNGLPTPNY